MEESPILPPLIEDPFSISFSKKTQSAIGLIFDLKYKSFIGFENLGEMGDITTIFD